MVSQLLAYLQEMDLCTSKSINPIQSEQHQLWWITQHNFKQWSCEWYYCFWYFDDTNYIHFRRFFSLATSSTIISIKIRLLNTQVFAVVWGWKYTKNSIIMKADKVLAGHNCPLKISRVLQIHELCRRASGDGIVSPTSKGWSSKFSALNVTRCTYQIKFYNCFHLFLLPQIYLFSSSITSGSIIIHRNVIGKQQ